VRFAWAILAALLASCAPRAWSPTRDGCATPPPFETSSPRDCKCRGVHEGRLEDVVEYRCGAEYITYVEPHHRPKEKTWSPPNCPP
jgi:hypothetical protein